MIRFPRKTLPVLSTARVLLRPVCDGDLEALWHLWTEPLVRRCLWDDVEIARERAAETLTAAQSHASRGLGLWMLQRPANSEGIGCAGLLPVGVAATFDPWLKDRVEPMIAVAPAYWHQGYATEVLAALIDHAFGTLGLAELAAVVDVPNEASHRLVARVGFRAVGECDGPKYRARTYRLTRR